MQDNLFSRLRREIASVGEQQKITSEEQRARNDVKLFGMVREQFLVIIDLAEGLNIELNRVKSEVKELREEAKSQREKDRKIDSLGIRLARLEGVLK